MICTTVRNGIDCPMMKTAGCSYTGGSCREIVEACKGCNRIIEYESGKYCNVVPDPALKWKIGICNMATHVKIEVATSQAKVNPLKASKRASRKR